MCKLFILYVLYTYTFVDATQHAFSSYFLCAITPSYHSYCIHNIRQFDNLTMCIYISTICIHATHTYCEIRACMLYMHTVFVIVIVTLSKLQFKLAPKFAPLSYRLKCTDRFLYYFALIAM